MCQYFRPQFATECLNAVHVWRYKTRCHSTDRRAASWTGQEQLQNKGHGECKMKFCVPRITLFGIWLPQNLLLYAESQPRLGTHGDRGCWSLAHSYITWYFLWESLSWSPWYCWCCAVCSRNPTTRAGNHWLFLLWAEFKLIIKTD